MISTRLSPAAAIKAITPGAIRVVKFRFEALGGGVTWIQTPKVHAKHALRALMAGSKVQLSQVGRDGTVLISGPIGDGRRDAEGDEA